MSWFGVPKKSVKSQKSENIVVSKSTIILPKSGKTLIRPTEGSFLPDGDTRYRFEPTYGKLFVQVFDSEKEKWINIDDIARNFSRVYDMSEVPKKVGGGVYTVASDRAEAVVYLKRFLDVCQLVREGAVSPLSQELLTQEVGTMDEFVVTEFI